LVWQRCRYLNAFGYDAPTPLHPPLTWIGPAAREGKLEGWRLKAVFQVIVIEAQDRAWRLAVPTCDVELVHQAVRLAS